MNICEECGYHLKMISSNRIELLIDPGTWEPIDEDMVSIMRSDICMYVYSHIQILLNFIFM